MPAGDGRTETETERSDRNWSEILQELRVTQTGTQILTGFLLTIPFQQRFDELTGAQLGIYLGLVAAAALATILAIAPVALHRALFRRQVKPRIVLLANWLLRLSLGLIGVTLVGTVVLVFDVVAGHLPAAIAAAATAELAVAAWVVLPGLVRPRRGPRD